MCDDIAWTMLASSMCPVFDPVVRVIIAEPSGVTNFYHNKIINGRLCIAL
jgi:hypothetical protein